MLDDKKLLELEKLKVEIFANEYVELLKTFNDKISKNDLRPYFILEPISYIECVTQKANEIFNNKGELYEN